MDLGEIERLDLRAPGLVLEGARFERCQGPAAPIGLGNAAPVGNWGRLPPTHRSIVRGVELRRCNFGLLASGVLFEDVSVDGLNGGGFFKLVACAFVRVRLAGRIRDVHISPPRWPDEHPDYWSPWLTANDAIHRDAEWILDISDGEFRNCMFRGIPASKIRLDPTRQAVADAQSISEAAKTFDPDDLVGVVGRSIRRAHEFVDSGAASQWDVVMQPEANSKTLDVECELIQELYRRGFVSAPEG